jgi:hypothetical protein
MSSNEAPDKIFPPETQEEKPAFLSLSVNQDILHSSEQDGFLSCVGWKVLCRLEGLVPQGKQGFEFISQECENTPSSGFNPGLPGIVEPGQALDWT